MAGRSVNTAVFYVYMAVPICTQPYSYKVTALPDCSMLPEL